MNIPDTTGHQVTV